jgi:hypothetical protein
MTKEEITNNITWDDYEAGELSVKQNTFGDTYTLYISPIDEQPKTVTDNMVKTINDFLNINQNDLAYIKEYIFWFCNLCCESTSYGIVDVKDGETETEANLRYFGVKNKEDAYAKSKLSEIVIETDEDYREVILIFYADWEDEHGCEIKIVNGKLERFKG